MQTRALLPAALATLALLVLAAAPGCSDDDSSSGGSSSSSSSSSGMGGAGGSVATGGAGGESCFGNDIVCTGDFTHACGAEPSTGTDCSLENKKCTPGVGCTVCVAGSGTCTQDGPSTYCKADGSALVEFSCDTDLGLSCSGDACVGACAPKTIQDSYLGCEYFPTTVHNNVNNNYDYEVAIANDSDTKTATIIVSGGALGSPVTESVAPGQVKRIQLPWQQEVKVCNEATLGGSFDQVNSCSVIR